MKGEDVVFFLVVGLAIWVLGTIYYGYKGQAVLETTPQQYWRAFAMSPIISAAMCFAILLWRQVPYAEWAPAVLLLAIPGMIGEALVLSHLSVFMPRIQAASGGPYGAFLFATYALVLTIAEAVSLAARRL